MYAAYRSKTTFHAAITNRYAIIYDESRDVRMMRQHSFIVLPKHTNDERHVFTWREQETQHLHVH